ncbi:glucan 1,3-beta-glucosidase [Botrytis cinerea]
MLSKTLLAVAASLSTASAVNQGFNYGATNADGSYRVQSDFQDAFETANSLVGTSGFNSARLYTMLQGDTTDPTSAIPAAIASDTTLLLGLWASGGAAGVTAEVNALKAAITKYGTAFTSRVVGISKLPTGIAANAGYGANPDDLVNYIKQVREAIAGTALSGASIGHVDTWTAWVNGSNSAVAEALDWVGMDAYPYFQDTEANGVSLGKSLFNSALAATQSATGKTVWVTETGWPVTGATAGDGIPSADNAKIYWDDVGCPNFGKINMYWYTLQDQNAASSVTPSFGIATSGVAALATGGSVASSGSGLSPTGMGAGISAVSGAASPTGTGSANGSPAGGSSNGTYTASTLKSASGSSATGSSTSGSGSSGSSGSSSGSASGSSSSSHPNPPVVQHPSPDLLHLPLEPSFAVAAAL